MQYNGRIFFPEKPEEKITTQLIVNDNEYYFEIQGSYMKMENFNIILGHFQGLGDVTLLSCYVMGGYTNFDYSVRRIYVSSILENINIFHREDIKFNRALINFPVLHQWANIDLVENKLLTNRTLKLLQLDDINLYENKKYTLSLTAYNSFKCNKEEIKINPQICLRINSNEGFLTLSEINDIINHFQKFLVFTINKNPDPEWITLYSDNHKYNNENIPIHYHIKNMSKGFSIITFSPAIKYKNISSYIQTIIKNWFEENKLIPSIDWVIEKSLTQRLSRENYFLNICFAIEVFHSWYFNEPKLSREELKKRKRLILNNIEDKEICEWLNDKLAYSGEQSFKDRLLFFKDDFDNILPSDTKAEEYIKMIVDTRNSFVHGTKRSKIFKGLDIYYASRYIESVLKISVFRVLEVNENEIASMTRCIKNELIGLYNLNKHIPELI